MNTQTNPTPAPKPAKIRLVCLECGRKKSVSPNALNDPRCSCGSVDLEVL